jgi:hypothetical protein
MSEMTIIDSLTPSHSHEAAADLLIERSGLVWGRGAFKKRSHAHAQRLWHMSQVRSFALKHHDVLHGVRTFKFPLIALNSGSMTKRARHILSQRVIAGTMNVQPPFVPDPETQR